MELVHSGEPPLSLNYKALQALIEAVRFRLADWETHAAQHEAALSEDDFADLQNDMMYLGSLLTALEDEVRRQAGRG
jgi:hypothetical protein